MTNDNGCLIFSSAASCEQALQSANCTACNGDDSDSSLGCPQWSGSAHVEVTRYSVVGGSNATSARVLAEFTKAAGGVVPAAVEAQLGQGRIITLLVDDVPTLQVR